MSVKNLSKEIRWEIPLNLRHGLYRLVREMVVPDVDVHDP